MELEKKMSLNNDKSDCIDSIVYAANRASAWRKTLTVKYTNDPGNLRAVKMLDQFAIDAAAMTEDQWSRLAPPYVVAYWQTTAHSMAMAKQPVVRLLEVTVTPQEPTLWKWCISEGDVEVAHGLATSRETAQSDGDAKLFALLSMIR